jgi:hypothetical protein
MTSHILDAAGSGTLHSGQRNTADCSRRASSSRRPAPLVAGAKPRVNRRAVAVEDEKERLPARVEFEQTAIGHEEPAPLVVRDRETRVAVPQVGARGRDDKRLRLLLPRGCSPQVGEQRVAARQARGRREPDQQRAAAGMGAQVEWPVILLEQRPGRGKRFIPPKTNPRHRLPPTVNYGTSSIPWRAVTPYCSGVAASMGAAAGTGCGPVDAAPAAIRPLPNFTDSSTRPKVTYAASSA